MAKAIDAPKNTTTLGGIEPWTALDVPELVCGLACLKSPEQICATDSLFGLCTWLWAPELIWRPLGWSEGNKS